MCDKSKSHFLRNFEEKDVSYKFRMEYIHTHLNTLTHSYTQPKKYTHANTHRQTGRHTHTHTPSLSFSSQMLSRKSGTFSKENSKIFGLQNLFS